MAQIRFEDLADMNSGASGNSSQVGFFSLKNDGDEAIVRIMHDNTDSFDLVSTHAINVGGRYRRVNCCRNPYDPIDSCPLCAAGNSSQQRFYIHLIQYTRNENGQIVAEPKVWERSLSYATTIKNLIVEYGPLSNVLFKIRRNGIAGSMDTTYSIMYASPNMYPEQSYPKIPNAFDGYTAIGTAVLNKSVQEVAYFVANGDFPQSEQPKPSQTLTPAPYVNPVATPVLNTEMETPSGNSFRPSIPNRPTRYY